MIVSRGSFLRVCGAALVGVSLPRWSRAAAPPAPAPVPAPDPASAFGAPLGAARFSPHVGSLFTIEETGQRVRLTDVAESTVSPGIEQFALHFTAARQPRAAAVTAPSEPSIPHGTYAFRHPALGRMKMFITPVGAPADGPVYQACFSRIRGKEESCPINT